MRVIRLGLRLGLFQLSLGILGVLMRRLDADAFRTNVRHRFRELVQKSVD